MSRSLDSRSLPIPVVYPLGSTGQDFFPSQNSKLDFSSKRNIRRCGEEGVAGEHGSAGNTSLGDDLVNKTVVLRMKKNFMKFMNLNYAWILKQRFLLHIWPGIWTLFVICTHEPILLHGHLRSISIEHCLLCVTPSASIFPIGLWHKRHRLIFKIVFARL